jgi:hypothetical protein
MRRAESKEIDGFVFHVTQLPGMRGVKLWHKLVRTAAPAVLKSLGGANASKLNLANMDVAALAEGAQILFQSFSESDLEQLIRTLFETAILEHEGQKLPLMQVFDDKLSGRVMTVLKGVWFALGVNFSDFLPELRAVGAAAPESLSKGSNG